MLYVLGAPLVLAALAIAVLHTGWGKGRVRALVLERLGERVNGQVGLGGVDYTLFGEARIEGLVLRDPEGVEAVAVSSLTVRPSWGDLARGHLVVDRVALDGLSLHVIKAEDGSSNLARLFRPRPEDPSKKPLDRRVVVRSLAISGVAVTVAQPDGTKIALSDGAVEGALSVLPSERSAEVEITKVALSALVDKGQGGMKLGVTGVETGLSLNVAGGGGRATLHPLKGHVAVTLPEQPERGFDIGLEGFSADIGEGGVGVSLDKLLAGAVALASMEVKGRVEDGKMEGPQRADVLGLKVSGARVNELAGREVLLGDIDIETHVSGPPDKIAVATRITTAGAAATVDGAVGVADPAHPTYEVAFTMTGVDTEKVLAPQLGIAPVAVEKVELKVSGRGRTADSAAATATLKVTGASAGGVRLDGVTFEGELERGILHVRSIDARGLGQRVTASGEIELATKRVDLTAGLEGDAGDVLARLKAAGLPIRTNLPRGAVRLPPGDLTITAKGFLGGALDVEAHASKLSVFGGTLKLGARASLVRHDPPLEGEKKVTVSALDADVTLGGIKLSSLLAMRGKKLEGMDGALSGELHVEGTPESPRAKVLLGLTTSRTDGGKTVRVNVSGDVTRGKADLRASILAGGETAELLGATAQLPLSTGGKPGLDLYRPLQIKASLPKRSFADLWALVPETAVPEGLRKVLEGGLDLRLIPGQIEMDLDLQGTAARPEGKLHAAVQTRAIPIFEQWQKVDVNVALKPAADGPAPAGVKANVDVDLWLDHKKSPVAHVKSGVALSRSPVLGPAGLAHHTEVTVGPLPLSELYMDKGLQELGGTILASLALDGDREDLKARVFASLDGIRPRGKGPVTAAASIDLGDDAATVDVKLRTPEGEGGAPKGETAVLAGKIGLSGKKLFAQLREKKHAEAPLDLTLSVPKRALASLAWLDPRLSRAPGMLSGALPITGTVKTPLVKGALAISDVPRADGQQGGAALALDAGPDELLATVGVGLPDAGRAPLQIAVRASRAAALGLGPKEKLPVFTTIRASKVDVRQLVPAAALEGSPIGLAGTLDWNMAVRVGLQRPAGKRVEVAEGSVSGMLDLRDATLPLAGTKRAYRDVSLHVAADERGIHLDALRAKESDPEVKERTLLVKADVGLDGLKPTTASAQITSDRWLLFGPKPLGKVDAPRGTLTLSAGVKADLTKPVRTVDVSVSKLEVLVPDRFERAHQPEDVHAGDIVFLGEDKVPLGKLPVPPKEDPAAIAAKQERAKRLAKGDAAEEGYDVRVQIPEGAHLLQAPIDLYPKGDVAVKIRPWGREIRANVSFGRGGLSLGGVPHGLVKGLIVFDDANPKGFLDLSFERPMRAAALRQISEASGGTGVKVHMYGPLSDRKTVLSGAGTAGALTDVLAMHNTGRSRYVSEPDLPWSMASEFPQHDNLLVLGFMAVNLPHLLFVDRFAVWADPYDDARAYGRLTHFEAERFALGNTLRFRLGARPPSAGQSEAEAEVDYVIINVPRMLLGVGLTGGTRGGGGAGLVWEWSSKD